MPLQGGHERPGRSPAVSGRPAKRSFTIGGHRTSISLEAAFWDALKAAAAKEGVPVSRLIARIDAERAGCGLSRAIRVWLLARFRDGAQ
jgi:predicted DNA-binding ribbon-helix-helix protein